MNMNVSTFSEKCARGHRCNAARSLALYLVVLEGEVLQIGGGVAFDRVQAVVEHGDDLRQLGLSPCGGGGSLAEGAVQGGHAASLTLGQGRAAPVVHVPGGAHVPVQGALITPDTHTRHTQARR